MNYPQRRDRIPKSNGIDYQPGKKVGVNVRIPAAWHDKLKAYAKQNKIRLGALLAKIVEKEYGINANQ